MVVLTTLAAMSAPVWAESTEAELRAAFIFSFAKYVDWPAEVLKANPTVLPMCLLGSSNEVFDALIDLNGKLIKGRNLQIRASTRGDNLKSCQMLVVADSEEEYFANILRRLEGAPVLTINGSSSFLDAGGIIILVAEGKKLRFDINLAAARRNDLVLSSSLLKLARKVRMP